MPAGLVPPPGSEPVGGGREFFGPPLVVPRGGEGGGWVEHLFVEHLFVERVFVEH